MFEQNGRCGYALKPRIMWDKTHPQFNRFNPFDKDPFAASNPAVLTVVVSLIFTLRLTIFHFRFTG